MKIKLTHHQIFTSALALLNQRGFMVTGHKADGETVVELEGRRTASQSFGKTPYVCQHEWPLECFIQCGGDGIVLTGKEPTLQQALTDGDAAAKVISGNVEHRRTAFFEAFPKTPNTFLRGEGEGVLEAEEQCWQRYQKILACTNHEYERRDRVDGYCFCKNCGLSGMFMQPLHPCAGCHATEYELWSTDKNGAGYCKTCHNKLSDDMLGEESKRTRSMLARLE